MKIRYQITKEDYEEAMKLVWQRPTKYYLFFAFLFLGLCLLGFFYGFDKWLIGLLVMFFVCSFIIFPLWQKFITHRNFYLHKDDITQMRMIELQGSGLYLSTVHSQHFIPWDKIKRWQENKDYILIYVRPLVVHIIPKGLSEQGFEVDEFRSRLMEFVGPVG